ncbi:rhodanese-like domain-containing protein [Aliidiomarina taiwanensis]|nr:rhodanese-like domain-containing protein [Aliidiomarina taiwanensis]
MDQIIQFATEHYIMSALWLAVLVMLVVDLIKRGSSAVTSLSAQEATIKVNRGGLFVDIRSAEEYNNGHIHGARNIPLQQIRDGNTKALEKYKDAPIITVCNYGNTARTAASLLEKAGFSQVSILQGGMQAWKGANMPVRKSAASADKQKKNKK